MREELKLIEFPTIPFVIKKALVNTAALCLFVYCLITLDATIKEIYRGIGLYPLNGM